MTAQIDPRQWMAVLEELMTMRECVMRLEHQTVNLVRASGASWEDIGEALGISRQSARRKYGQPRKRLI
jgi:hypothetical protein